MFSKGGMAAANVPKLLARVCTNNSVYLDHRGAAWSAVTVTLAAGGRYRKHCVRCTQQVTLIFCAIVLHVMNMKQHADYMLDNGLSRELNQ